VEQERTVVDEPETATSQGLSPDEKPAPRPKKETRPRFDSVKEIEAEISFRKDLPAEKPTSEVPKPTDLAPVVAVSDEVESDDEEESTDLVKADRKALAGVLPLAIDYTGYITPQYPRVDPAVNLRSVQAEAVDEFFDTKLRRPVIVLPTGCIDGEAIVQVNRAGKGFKTTLAHLCYKFNGGASEQGKVWDPSIPTYVKSLVGGDLRLHRIDGVLDKGEKDCVELKLESGKTLVLTPDHEVCTNVTGNGEQTYKRADELLPNDHVLTNGTAACGTCGRTKNVVTRPSAKFRGHCRDCIHGQLTFRHSAGKGILLKGYKYITYGMRYHPNRFKAGKRWVVAEHRLVAEAKLNGLTLNEWLEIIRTNSFTPNHKFISRSTHVHHENETKTDNSAENLVPKDSIVHLSEHARASGFRNMNGGRAGRGGEICFIPKTDRVVSITPVGKRRVYDIVCQDPWRNFVANGVVVHNCGKTVAGLTIAGRINGRVLWIAHRDELITQPANEIKTLFPGLEYGIEKAESAGGTGKRVVIASIQTLQKTERLKRIMSGAPFSLVIYDECHHAAAVSSLKILTRLGCLRDDGKGPMLLGLTATPERADKVSLGTVFEDVIYSCSIQRAIELGYLVPPKPIKVYLPINKAALKTVKGDYATSDLDRELARVNAAQATAAAILANCGTRKTIAFCTSINQAQRTAAACERLGLKAAWVSGAGKKNQDGTSNGMKKAERKKVLKSFSESSIQVLVNAEVLTEGYDEKSIGAVVIARPTKSQGRYLQMAGRGLRTHAHKTDCLLIDITGASDLGLVGADILLKKSTDKKIKKKPKRTEVADSNTEWQKLQSYLRSARIDTFEHGELTFARASEDMVVTVANDRELVILRRIAPDGSSDQWAIEHGGIVYTPEPLTFVEALSVCDTLLPSFGGGAKPGSEEWNAAADKPTPPPAVQPGVEPRPSDSSPEATRIVEPEARLPLAMNFVSGADVSDLADQVTKDLLNSNAEAFAKGIRSAIKNKKCHLLGFNRKPPEKDAERWGWEMHGTKLEPAGWGASVMIGWVYGDTAFIDVDAVKIAQEQLAAMKDDREVKIGYLRKHLGVVHKMFKSKESDWIKVRASDIDSTQEKAR
jgi:ATP-dependent helicase IRC3